MIPNQTVFFHHQIDLGSCNKYPELIDRTSTAHVLVLDRKMFMIKTHVLHEREVIYLPLTRDTQANDRFHFINNIFPFSHLKFICLHLVLLTMVIVLKTVKHSIFFSKLRKL